MSQYPHTLLLSDMESISKLLTLNSPPTSQLDRLLSATALSSPSNLELFTLKLELPSFNACGMLLLFNLEFAQQLLDQSSNNSSGHFGADIT